MVDLVQSEDNMLPESKSSREELIDKIQARERAERDGIETSPEPEQDELQPEEDTGTTDEVGELEPAADDEVEQEQQSFVTVKIDGKEQQVDQEKILDAGVRTFQKESAADKRLQEASVQLKRLQEYEYQLRQREEALAKALPAKKADEPKPQSKHDRQVYRQTAEALYSGDEDAAAEALEKLLEGRDETPAAPQIDPNALVQEAVRRTRQQMSVENARESFASEFTEIIADPVLTRLADEESAVLLRDNPEMTAKQNLMEAGRRVRNWVEAHGGGNHAPAPESQKAERKRAIKPVKAAGGKIPSKPEEKPKTRSDIVADMRKQRGLPD